MHQFEPLYFRSVKPTKDSGLLSIMQAEHISQLKRKINFGFYALSTNYASNVSL